MSAKKNVMVFTTWSYKDGLIQAATLPYLKVLQGITGGDIYLICWEKAGLELTPEEYRNESEELARWGITLLRISYHKNKIAAVATWAVKMIQFLFLMYRKRIGYLHAFCTPAGSIALFASWFKKVHLTVDSMEPHADMMAETGVWNPSSRLYKIMFALEKKLVRRADRLIAVSKSIRPYLVQKYGIDPPADKLYYRPLCVSSELFKPRTPDYCLLGWTEKKARRIGVYTGKLGGMYYESEFCLLLKECIRFWGEDFHLVFCTPMDKAQVSRFLVENGIAVAYFTIVFAPHTEIPAYLALADFGMSLSRPSAARQYGCPTKNAEYWAMGLPVLTTHAILDDTRDLAENPYLGVEFETGALPDLTLELERLEQLIVSPGGTARRKFALQNRSFEIVKSVYRQIYS